MIRVLIVEDDADLQFLYNTAFTFSRFEVQQAETSTEAIAALDDGLFQAIVLDLNLPDAHGSVVLDAIEKHPEQNVENVIIITANDHWIDNVTQRGVQHILVKPVNMMDVAELIKRLAL